jgi:hypothetical protein
VGVPAAAMGASSAGAASGASAGAGAGKASKGSTRAGRAEGDGTAKKSDYDRIKREGRKQDRAYRQAYTMGQAGEPPDPTWDQATRDAYDQGVDDAARQRREERGDRAGQRTSGRPGGGAGSDLVNDGAGFLLGLFVYALVLNYLRGGPDRVKGWLAAKFINKPWAAKRARRVPRGGG